MAWRQTYRKVHLPCLGVDGSATAGGPARSRYKTSAWLQIGMNICYDGIVPGTARCLDALGADLVVLPTNWPAGHLMHGRGPDRSAGAGEPRSIPPPSTVSARSPGFRFLGRSRLVNLNGGLLAASEDDQAEPINLRRHRPRRRPGKRSQDTG